MRAVIDTNVLLSGLIWHGAPHTLIEQVRAGALTLVSSPALLTELAEVAHLALGAGGNSTASPTRASISSSRAICAAVRTLPSEV